MIFLLSNLFLFHDWASGFLAKHYIAIKRGVLIVAHLSLFGFFFPELRKDFGEMAANLLIIILFLSPLSKIFHTRILLQLMGLRREFGITMAYLATVHGVGFMLDPRWFELAIAPDLAKGVWAIHPAFLAGGAAYLLTLPLFLTSNNLAQRILGGKWKILHRLVYGALIFAVLHRFFISGGTAFEMMEAALLLSAYILVKVLAWKNFCSPLRSVIHWVASRYRTYIIIENQKGTML